MMIRGFGLGFTEISLRPRKGSRSGKDFGLVVFGQLEDLKIVLSVLKIMKI